jgi:hypothetical protein
MKNPLFKQGIRPGTHRLGGVGVERKVKLKDLVSTQALVDDGKIKKLSRFTKNMPGKVTVSHRGHGKYSILDGNHRINAMLKQGKRKATVLVQKLSSRLPLIQFGIKKAGKEATDRIASALNNKVGMGWWSSGMPKKAIPLRVVEKDGNPHLLVYRRTASGGRDSMTTPVSGWAKEPTLSTSTNRESTKRYPEIYGRPGGQHSIGTYAIPEAELGAASAHLGEQEIRHPNMAKFLVRVRSGNQKLSAKQETIQFMHNTEHPSPIAIKRRPIKPRNPIQQLSAQLDSAIEFTTGRLLGGGILAGTAWEDTEEGKRFLKAATQQKDPRASDETGVKHTYRTNPATGKRALDTSEVVVKKGAPLTRRNPEGKRQIFKKGEWSNEIKPSDLRDTEGMRTVLRSRIATQHEPAVRKGWDESDFKRHGMASAPPRVRAALARGIEGSRSEKQAKQVLAATKFIGHNQTRGPMEGIVQKIRGTTEGGASGILRDVQINRRLLQTHRRSLNEKAKKAGEAIPHPQAEPMSAEGMKEIQSAPKYKEGERPKKYSIAQGKVRDMSGNPIHTPEPILRPGEENMLRSARGRLSSKGGLVEQETTRRKVLSQRLYGRLKQSVTSKLPRKIAAKTNVDDLLKPITRPHDPSEIQEINKRSVVTRDAGIEARNRQIRADRFARHAAEIGDVEIPQGFQPPPADKRSVQSPLVIKTVSERGRVIKPYEELAGTLGIKGKSGRSAGERLGRIRERFNRLASPDAAETRKITNRLIDSGKAFTGGSIPIPKAKVNPSYPRLKIAGAGAALVGAGLLAHKLMRNNPEEEQRKRLAMSSRSPVIYFAKGKAIKKAAGKIAKKASGVIDTGGAVGPLQPVAAILKKQGVGPKIPLAKQLSMARSEAEAAINKANEVRQTSGELVGHAIRSSEKGINAAKAAASERIASAEAAHAEALKAAAASRARGMEGAAAGGLVAGTGLGGWLMARDKKKELEFSARKIPAFSLNAAKKNIKHVWDNSNTAQKIAAPVAYVAGQVVDGVAAAATKGWSLLNPASASKVLPVLAHKALKSREQVDLLGRSLGGFTRQRAGNADGYFIPQKLHAKGSILRFERKKEAPAWRKAAISSAVSGGVLGSLSAFKKGSKAIPVLKNVAGAAGLGAALGGGGTYIGSKILGAPDKNDPAAITKRAALGGAIAGLGLGGGVVLALRKGKNVPFIGTLKDIAKDWRGTEFIKRAPVVASTGAGALVGGLAAGAYAADEGQQVDTMRNLKKPVRMSSKSPIIRFADMPLTGKLAADRYRKKIQDEDLDRRDANILRTAGAGAALGGLLGGKKGALIGAATGAPIVPIVRSQTASGKDLYGERSRQGKQAESLPWKLAGLGAAGVLAHKGNQKLTAAKIGITKWGRRAKMGALGAAGLWAASKMFSANGSNDLIRFAYDEDDYDATERNLLRQGLQQQQDKDWRKIKSATNKAAQAGKRVKRLTQDIGRSWRGEKNVDSRGRERQREWDKPWFRNTLNTGIIGGAALGALAIKRGINPKGNLGKAITNVKQGVLTEKLSKVAPRTVGAYRKAKTFFTGAGDEAADALNKSEAVVSQTGPVAKFNKWVESGHGLRAVDDPQKALKALEAAKKKRLKTDPRHGKTIDAAIQGTLEHSSKLIPIHFDQRTEGDRLMLVRDIQRRQQRADAGKAKKENEKTKDVAIASGVGLGGMWMGKRWGRIAERKAQGLPVPAGLGTRIWRGIKAMSSKDPLIELNSILNAALT